MIVALIANGPIDNIKTILMADHYIAVDGGLRYCQKGQICPHLIIGDFDSVTDELLSAYKDTPTKRFPSAKDQTDLELAVMHALSLKPDKIYLFGAVGGRTDHTLSNLYLLMKYPNLIIEADSETIFLIKDEATIQTVPGQVVSLLAFCGEARGVSSKGLKWELKDATFNASFLSQSNEALGDRVGIWVKEGVLLCILQKELKV